MMCPGNSSQEAHAPGCLPVVTQSDSTKSTKAKHAGATHQGAGVRHEASQAQVDTCPEKSPHHVNLLKRKGLWRRGTKTPFLP